MPINIKVNIGTEETVMTADFIYFTYFMDKDVCSQKEKEIDIFGHTQIILKLLSLSVGLIK